MLQNIKDWQNGSKPLLYRSEGYFAIQWGGGKLFNAFAFIYMAEEFWGKFPAVNTER